MFSYYGLLFKEAKVEFNALSSIELVRFYPQPERREKIPMGNSMPFNVYPYYHDNAKMPAF